MSVLAELRPPAAPPTAPGRSASPFLVAVLACSALAALSAAVLPTVPSYDPWAWVVWGREVVDPHLSFTVSGGPSWKPLPVIFTAVFALFGGAAPTLWVITARAGGLLGVVAAYRLAAVLVEGRAWRATAGVIAALGVILTRDWAYYMFRGTSEPMLIGTALWAVERHLAGRRTTAFVLGVATSLMRPEAWPFVGLYAIWLWLRDPSFREPWRRAVLGVGLLAIPFFWFVPPWIGSGQPFLAAVHAKEYNGHLGASPFATVVRRGVDLQVLPALILAGALVLLRRRDRLTLALAGLTLAWSVIVVGMTLDGYPGLERFYLPAAAMTCVLAGAAVVRLAQLTPIPRLGPVIPLVLVGASIPFVTTRVSTARAQEPIAERAVTRLDQLADAARAVGGHNGVYRCHSSFAAVNHSVQTALAWRLHVTLGRVGTSMRHQGLMFQGPHDSIDGGPPRINPRLTQRQLIAVAGPWRVYRLTAPGANTRCVGG